MPTAGGLILSFGNSVSFFLRVNNLVLGTNRMLKIFNVHFSAHCDSNQEIQGIRSKVKRRTGFLMWLGARLKVLLSNLGPTSSKIHF